MGRGRIASAAALVAGVALRLVFAASLAAGVYGVYLGWFVSVGQPGPGRDRLAGTEWMGLALGVSLVASGLLLTVPPLARRARPAWYGAVYAVFATVFITVVLPLSGALRTIGTWERSNTQVLARASGCYTTTDSDGNSVYHCDLTWSVGGHTYEQVRPTHDSYPDGTAVALWVDPATGGADDHDWVVEFCCFLVVFCGLLASAGVLLGCADAVANASPALPSGRAARTASGAAAQAPAPASEVSDTVPGDTGADDTVIEDARPDQ